MTSSREIVWTTEPCAGCGRPPFIRRDNREYLYSYSGSAPVCSPRCSCKEKCFACERPIKEAATLVTTADGQNVYVGPDCFAKVIDSDTAGYQPPLGGPKLYCLNKI